MVTWSIKRIRCSFHRRSKMLLRSLWSINIYFADDSTILPFIRSLHCVFAVDLWMTDTSVYPIFCVFIYYISFCLYKLRIIQLHVHFLFLFHRDILRGLLQTKLHCGLYQRMCVYSYDKRGLFVAWWNYLII